MENKIDELQNNFTDILIEQPEEIKTPLYPHQLASVYQMEKREKYQRIIDKDNIIDMNISIQADKMGYGKCVGFDTPIIMYDGEIKRVQDIKVGELVMGDDSTARKVISLARGREEMFKIIQNIGDDYSVNKSHILSLKMTCPKYISIVNNIIIQAFYFNPEKIMFNSMVFNYGDYDFDVKKAYKAAEQFLDSLPDLDTKVDISVEKYLKLSKTIQKHLKGYKRDVNCWENKLEKDDIDPYLMGLWLGSGTSILSDITTQDKEIVNYLEKYCEQNNLILYRGKRSKTKINYIIYGCFKSDLSSNSMLSNLICHNLLGNKHIPRVYKINNRENRLKLLAGIIDTDGCYKNGVYEIIQKSDIFTSDIKFLCGSLGFECKVKKVKKRCIYKGYNKIYISGKDVNKIPVLLERNRVIQIPTTLNKYDLCTGVKLESLGIGDYYGFVLDGNHRFLLGDFTVTHNTLSLVTLIYRNNMEWDMGVPFCQTNITSISDGRIKKTSLKYYEKLDVTLVLAGQSIINQWYDECHKSPLCVKKVITKKDIDTVLVENYDVILVTPSMYNNFVLKYSGMAWKRFIYDEPGHIKVPAMKKIVAGFIWLVTATPMAIVANYQNCRNSFMSDIAGSMKQGNYFEYINYIIVKNPDSFVESSFSMPVTHHHYHKCYNPLYKTLYGLVNSKITDMISAGNIQGAVRALGGEETQNIAELIRKKKENEILDLQSIIDILLIRDRQESRTRHIEDLRGKIDRLKLQIDELNTRYIGLLDGDCNICYEKIENPVMEPSCQNVFCGKCLLKWLESNNTCPLCRESVKVNKLIYIGFIESEEKEKERIGCDKVNVKMTKIEKVLSLIKGKKEGKFIIFSSFDQTFSPIREMLKINNISFIEVKGAISTRDKNLTSFKTGGTNVIFLNSENNGSGINLQESTDLIVYHDMDTSTLSQIIGRANRLGRVNSLEVHHLQIE